MTREQSWLNEVADAGFSVVPAVFTPAEVQALVIELEQALSQKCAATAIRSRADTVYAARNLHQLWPRAAAVWRQPPLPTMLTKILGPHFGLVRGLFFDKPPEQTWALPWHKDLTIAVRAHGRPSVHFAKPTSKAGVPHLEASQQLLEAMLTLRIHLDDVTDRNGPLRVLPGSHRTGKAMHIDEARRQSILVRQGDVLLIRPLVAHCSAASHPDNRDHRRIIHLEFAAQNLLPDGYAWHTFLPGLEA